MDKIRFVQRLKMNSAFGLCLLRSDVRVRAVVGTWSVKVRVIFKRGRTSNTNSFATLTNNITLQNQRNSSTPITTTRKECANSQIIQKSYHTKPSINNQTQMMHPKKLLTISHNQLHNRLWSQTQVQTRTPTDTAHPPISCTQSPNTDNGPHEDNGIV